nr:hypothetical protein [Tanacetum cinerariifolium]
RRVDVAPVAGVIYHCHRHHGEPAEYVEADEAASGGGSSSGHRQRLVDKRMTCKVAANACLTGSGRITDETLALLAAAELPKKTSVLLRLPRRAKKPRRFFTGGLVLTFTLAASARAISAATGELGRAAGLGAGGRTATGRWSWAGMLSGAA